MGFGKFLFFIVSCGLLIGCASFKSGQPQESKTSLYEEGYRKGVSENINRVVEKLNGNDFPYLGGTWAAPVVQEVKIPAHVQGVSFIQNIMNWLLLPPVSGNGIIPSPLKQINRI